MIFCSRAIFGFNALALACSLPFTGCISCKPANEKTDLNKTLERLAQASPFSVAARQRAYDIVYCTVIFFHKEGRWPKDYGELQNFVKRSNGVLLLESYQGVEFTPKPPDRLEISYGSSSGVTNRMTLEPPAQKSE
jgi:hypothetical protein